MKQPCIHCGVVDSHRPNCIVAVVQARDDRDAAREARARPKFVNVNASIMRGAEHIATAITKTMAKRIANALNHYRPGPKGF